MMGTLFGLHVLVLKKGGTAFSIRDLYFNGEIMLVDIPYLLDKLDA